MRENKNDVIEIDKKLIEEILWHLEFIEDDGPEGKGWKSEELLQCIQQLKEALQKNTNYVKTSGFL